MPDLIRVDDFWFMSILSPFQAVEYKGFVQGAGQLIIDELATVPVDDDKYEAHSATEGRSFLPEILTREEVNQILAATDNLKHKAILSVIYSAGLRVSEAVHLKIADIDSPNMRIHIRQGKGFKDRNSILLEITLFLLRDYYRKYRPKEWLFPGIDPAKPLHVRTPQVVFHESVKRDGITKKFPFIRHAFATHLLNQETPLLMIQELLGHADINTTTKYIHLTHAQVLGVKSPLDHPEGNPND